MGFLAGALPAIGNAIGGIFGHHAANKAVDIQGNENDLLAEALKQAQLSTGFGQNTLMPLFQNNAQSSPNYISSATPYMQNAGGAAGTGQAYTAAADPFINQAAGYLGSVSANRNAANGYISGADPFINQSQGYINAVNPIIGQAQNYIGQATPILNTAKGMLGAASPDFSSAEKFVNSVTPMLGKSEQYINDISPLAQSLNSFIQQRMDLGSPYYQQHQYESANAVDKSYADQGAQLQQQLAARQMGMPNTGTAVAAMGQMAQQQASGLSEAYLQNLFQNENTQMQAAGMMPLVSNMRGQQAQLEQANAQLGLGQSSAMNAIGQSRVGQGAAYGNLAQIPLGQAQAETGLGNLRLGQSAQEQGLGNLRLGQAQGEIGVGNLGLGQAQGMTGLAGMRVAQGQNFINSGNLFNAIGNTAISQGNANTNFLNTVNPLTAWNRTPATTQIPGSRDQLSNPTGLGIGNAIGSLGSIFGGSGGGYYGAVGG